MVNSRHILFGALIFVLALQPGFSQSTNVPISRGYNDLLDRYEILSGANSTSFHSAFKAYKRSAVMDFATGLDSLEGIGTVADRFNIEFLKQDNWEWGDNAPQSSEKPFLKYFYRSKSDLYHVKNEDVDLHINPVIHFSAGYETESSITPWINTRGVEVRGVIDDKVGFYSFIGENQATLPFYVREFVSSRGVVPHEGFWKDFKTNGYDFFTARGYLSFQISKHITTQFGHDRFFIGNGYRSMILSDFSPPYLFLKLNTRVGKVQYTNLFTQMRADAFGNLGGSLAGTRFPSKYVVLHHLSVNIGKKLNVGAFEAITYGREDSTGINPIDLNYLNPVIFYRAIEQQNGSTDNVIVGADFKWILKKNYSLYGQLVIDEFVLDEIRAGNGWWANKYAFQIGGKYINVAGISNLDLLVEHNYGRPFIYSHQSIYTNYGHYLQELAHPLGANLREWVVNIRYQPLPRLTFGLRTIASTFGGDENPGTNWGGDIFKDNRTRVQEYGNETGQGVSTDLLFFDFTATFQWKHNAFFDIKYVYRDLQSADPFRNRNTHFPSVSFRLNIPERLHEF